MDFGLAKIMTMLQTPAWHLYRGLHQYYMLGVHYVTFTHIYHNLFMDSCRYAPRMIPLHSGCSLLSLRLIDEMNCLRVLVDLSHTSDDTVWQALKHSKVPLIWSHLSAHAAHNIPRNMPDDVLALIRTSAGQMDAVVMVNFALQFVASPSNTIVYAVAEHVEHIPKVVGKNVSLGRDYDGINSTPIGLEDVSKYPALFAKLYTHGWNKYKLAGLAGANLLHVFEGLSCRKDIWDFCLVIYINPALETAIISC
ncbi:renal dipeptidase family [Mycena latifolia]|nr:renal dipeptidase family [Mycena latifolia]